MYQKIYDDKDKIKFDQQRHLGSVYIPRKGRSSIADKNDRNNSQILKTVLKPSREEIENGLKEYTSSFRQKNNTFY